MATIQLVYASRPFGFDEATLSGILFTARANNTRDGITGALICRADLYLQMLEGPQDKVESAYARIEQDDRHLEVKKLVRSPIETRMFGAWAMRSDPAESWMWTREQVENGAPAARRRRRRLRYSLDSSKKRPPQPDLKRSFSPLPKPDEF